MFGSFSEFITSLGINPDTVLENVVYLPPIVLALALVAFVITFRKQSMSDARERMARKILVSSAVKRPGMTREEIAARLAPKSIEAKSPSLFIVLFEVLLKLVRFDRKETQRKLIQSGDRDPRAISRYIIQRGLGMVIGPVVIWFIAPFIGIEGMLQFIVALVGVLAGGILVDSRLDKALKNRKIQVSNEMPVLMDLLTMYLEAGQPFDASLVRASRALEKSFPVIAEEAAFLIRDLDMSVDREKTLREFAERLSTTSAKTFMTIVIQSEKRGNAIAPSLRMLARDSRKEVIMELERRAQKLPTMMQLPMFLFILPAIFASVIGPAAIQIMGTFSGGLIPATP